MPFDGPFDYSFRFTRSMEATNGGLELSLEDVFFPFSRG